MKMPLRLLLLTFLSMAALFAQQDITGDWLGTIKTGGPDLRLAMHITKAANGTLAATFDSVDQGAHFPASSIRLNDSSLSITAELVHGTYEGKVNADASVISGTWSQGQPMPLEFRRGVVKEAKAAKPSDIDGVWSGVIDIGVQKLRIIYHVLNTEDGLTAHADIPDQGVKAVPVVITRNGAALKLEIKAFGATFEGKIASDGKTIPGTFTQGPVSAPLVLSPVKDAAALERRRPQNPTKPYPYREEEVSYENKVQNVHLAATLTLPQGKGPFPGVVLITGSGPQDRDEALLGHRPFLVLADHLTRTGIAVLRADDRGMGQSTGVFAQATTADFATDAEASLAYLKSRQEVDPHKLGLIGHSEGGVIAPMVAARNAEVAFIVLMAGTGVRGDEVLSRQLLAIEESMGKSHAEAEKDAAAQHELLLLAEHEKDDAVLSSKMRELKVPDGQIAAQLKQIRSPWFQYFLQYDPAVALRQVKCPVLAINGEKDTQVIPSQNLPAIREALEAGGNKQFETEILPGLNHLFQTAKTGSPNEYAEIEETISPIALERMSNWILKQ